MFTKTGKTGINARVRSVRNDDSLLSVYSRLRLFWSVAEDRPVSGFQVILNEVK